jgi:hypothetical protein
MREATSLRIPIEQSVKRAEAFELPESFTLEVRQRLFRELALLHDLAEEAMVAVESVGDAILRKKQREIASRYSTQVHCSADILMAFYNEVAFEGRPITSELQEIFEKAFQKAHFAYLELREQIDVLFPPHQIDPQSLTVVQVVPLLRNAPQRKSKPTRR